MYDYTHAPTGEHLTEAELQVRFDVFFDEVYEMIRFGELFYVPSRVLHSVDPVAYREAFNNWIDNQIDIGEYREYSDSQK